MKGLVWRAILTTTSRLLLALFSVALADADISPGICPERDEVGDTISKIEANVNGPGTVVCKYNGNVICAYFADGNLDTENSENSDLCHPHTKQPSTTTEATRTSCSISPTTPPASIGPVSTQSIASTFTTSIATSAEGEYIGAI
ncbi:hypothetical protein B0H16DRAFT_495898 [Mycena metata]|uniref:Uncharacterized protein n=1 Tax=Mycena metata TaxID=1033252 RepID=A0AAD7H9Q5_9AGAR|nr:hypothetical protein B0H16DRAFT_495898 [Mycena metata]